MIIGKCSSDKCNPQPKNVKHRSSTKTVIKIMAKTAKDAPMFCPDCQYALFYERKGEKKVKKKNKEWY